jgi:GT2 family glycosyltransferase
LILVDQSGYHQGRIAEKVQDTPFQHVRLKKANLPNARNRGAEAAHGEILLFIDDDALPRLGWIDHHLARYGDGRIGCVGGRVEDANAKGEASVPVRYDPKDGTYQTDFGCRAAQETISVPGVNFSVRKAAWEQVRFDPVYKGNAYFEEVDFAFCLRKAGWKVFYEPAAVVEHQLDRQGGCRMTGLPEIYYRFRNYALFYCRHSGVRHFSLFCRKEKNFAEYISRNGHGGHRPALAATVIFGMAAGMILGSITRRKYSLR